MRNESTFTPATCTPASGAPLQMPVSILDRKKREEPTLDILRCEGWGGTKSTEKSPEYSH